MNGYSDSYQQDNNIEVSVFASQGGTIVFDLTEKATHTRAAFSRNKLYQNLTVKEAKTLRKTLKHAIREAAK